MLDYNQPIDRARPEAPQQRPQAGFNVLELVNLLWRRKIAIAAAALLGATLAVTAGKSVTPRYTATAQLYVDPRELQLVDRELTPRAQDVSGMAMVVESQARLITSNSVLLQVIQQAGLDKDPEFGGGGDVRSLMSSLLGLIGLQPRAPSGADNKEVQLAALEALNRHITIRKTEKSFIVDIEVWSTDPAKAAMLANTLTSAYLAESRNSQASAARRATNDLSGRLKELRERLRSAETALATYKAQNNFVGTQDALISDQQLSASNQRLSAARAATMDAQARLDQIEASRRTAADAGANSEALQSPTIANLRAQYADARKKYAEQAGELGPRHPANAEALAQLAGIAIYRSDLRGAEEMSRRALEIRRESLDANDPLIGASLELHASHLRRLGNTAGAEAELREGIAVYRAGGGPTSPDAAYLELRLADVIFEGRGDTAQAESLIRSALAMTRASLGEDHPRTSWAMGDLSDLLAQKGEFAEAEQLARSGLAIMRRAFGDHHPNVADFQRVLVSVHVRAGRLAEAEKGQRESIAVLEKAFGPRHAAYAGALGALSDILMGLHRYDEAIIATRRMIDIRRSLFGEEGAGYGIDLSRMARLYARTHDFRTADSLFRLALDNQRKYVPDDHYDVRNIYALMAERYGLEGNRNEQLRYARMAQPR